MTTRSCKVRCLVLVVGIGVKIGRMKTAGGGTVAMKVCEIRGCKVCQALVGDEEEFVLDVVSGTSVGQ